MPWLDVSERAAAADPGRQGDFLAAQVCGCGLTSRCGVVMVVVVEGGDRGAVEGMEREGKGRGWGGMVGLGA